MLGYFEIVLAAACFFFLLYLGCDKELPWTWPLVGMLPSLLTVVNQIHERCTVVLGRTGGTFLLKGPSFGNMDMLLTVDLTNVHYIMSSKFTNFPKGPEFRKIFDVLGDGIFNSDSDSWRNQRKLARAMLSHHRFYKFLVKTSQEKVEKGLIPVLEHVANQGLKVDMQDSFQRLNFDTTTMLVTGYDPGCLSTGLPDVPFSKAMDNAEEAVFMRHVLPPWFRKLQSGLGIGKEKKLRKAWATLDHVIGDFISMKRNQLLKKMKSEVEEDGVDL
ncbi:hypothetical protein RJ639_007756 [Escallonia herrerae]|uniref:Cytochrome P450 n=1 Tax=Escallonia herrerae TaxID=1293975 RepID=A0AA88VXE4_9ASTE|nr:hypothetical protein RJ639_007756 [Escallonia herrerae]